MMDDDFFRHMDHMMRTINQIHNFFGLDGSPEFRGFFGYDDNYHDNFPNDVPFHVQDLPGPDYQPGRKALRHEFLEPSVPVRHQHDRNMDRRVDLFCLDSVLAPGENQMAHQPFVHSKFKSYEYKWNNGRVEERRVEQDSSGKRIESHTRKLGDKAYTVTSKGDASGVKEIDENLVNMDENEVGAFEKMWKSNYPSWIEKDTEQRRIEVSPVEQAKPKALSWTEKLKSWLPSLK